MKQCGAIAIMLAAPPALLGFAHPAAASQRLSADPASMPPPAAVETGFVEFGDGAFAFVPRGTTPDRPAPLLVMMHGAGGDAHGLVRRFRRAAQAHGIVLLGVKSLGPTWDLIAARASHEVRASRIDRRAVAFRTDPARIDAALRALLARVPVDRRRIGLAGFSDGASYALSIGTANPQIFSSIIAFSPGMAEVPRQPHAGQRVFVSHGTDDPVLSFDFASRVIVPRLKERRLDVTFRPFEGRHIIPDDVGSEGIAFFVGAGGPQR